MSLLKVPRPPTAIFAANDLSAIAILEVARRIGMEVPRDLSVVGFDDIPEASQFSTPLSTVRQPMRRLGAEAANMLVLLLNGDPLPATHLVLPTRLVPRATTAPPRRA